MQSVATTSDNKPLVFFSACSEDNEWRDRLKSRLDSFGDQMEWWDDSRIETGNNWPRSIYEALALASIAVVLLSRNYVQSKSAAAEFEQLSERAQAGRLKLFPVVLTTCAWDIFPLLREVMIWANARPILESSETDIEPELDRIAKAIFAMAVDNPNVNTGLQFSVPAQQVLKRAREIAETNSRAGVTSNCLLFAFADMGSTSSLPVSGIRNEIGQLIRSIFDRSRGYAAAFREFCSEPGNPSYESVADGSPWLGRVSANVRKMLDQAADIVVKVSTLREIQERHLFGALLLAQSGDQPHAWERLSQAGMDIRQLRERFRQLIRQFPENENLEAWDALLAPDRSASKRTETPLAEAAPVKSAPESSPDGASPPSSFTRREGRDPYIKPEVTEKPQTPPDSPPSASPYASGPAGYSSEFCGLGGKQPVADHLGVEALAHRLAELIALRETRLPLAVGLFGNWGSGKSHFMNLMDRHLQKLAQEKPEDWARRANEPGAPARPDPEGKGPWCQQIVPIYFNAWHYLDANLWASLVTKIFEDLFLHLAPKPDELKLVRERLKVAGGTTARAEEELELAKAAAAKARSELEAAQEVSAAARSTFEGMVDNLWGLLPDLNKPAERERIADLFGVQPEVASLSKLAEKRHEVATLPGQVREIWRRIFVPKGRAYRLGWLIAAVIIGPALLYLAATYGPASIKWMNETGWIQAGLKLAAAVVPVASWLLLQAQRRLGQMNALLAKAEAAQEEKKRTPAVKVAEQKLSTSESAVTSAAERLTQALSLQQQLQKEEAELAPGRRITRFIEARAQSADYRGQLGLISLAHRDFRELSNLFANVAEGGQKDQPAVERIVLFIDDLDRCRPEKVVEVLQAVHLLLAFPLFAVVVGVDQRCLRQSLRMQFKGLLTPDHETKNGHDPDFPDVADGQERPATPLDYLEKIFHVPFHLPPMERRGFTTLIEQLTKPPTVTPPLIAKETQTLLKESPDVQERHPMYPHLQEGLGIERLQLETQHYAAPEVRRPDFSSPTPSDRPALPPFKVIGSVPLLDWERQALKDYHPLIRTPRGATRLLNTYRLVRAGITEKDWESFCEPREHRVMMLLLASAAGFPADARDWFSRLRREDIGAIQVDESDPGWKQFKAVYNDAFKDTLDRPGPAEFGRWLPLVEQFAF